MPDSDDAGLKYRGKVVASLEKREIQHCVVTFDGFKDVSEYLDAPHTRTELVQRIEDEWANTVGQEDVLYHQPSFDHIPI